ncbi:MAG: aryl-sulfate sulfotransferase [Saprospiraceae bacterium]
MSTLVSPRTCWYVISLILLSGLLMTSCDSGPKPLMDGVVGRVDMKVNPFNVVPLGALLTFNTREACQVTIRVTGPDPVEHTFPAYATSHGLPVLGLYADTVNTVELILTNRDGVQYKGEIYIPTEPLPDFLPSVEIVKADRKKMEPGWHLTETLIANSGKFAAYLIMFDDRGVIRWFIDLSAVQPFAFTPNRLKNGNWLFVSWVEMYELSDLGQLVRHERLTGYSADHDVIQLQDGSLLMGASKKDATIIRNGKPVESRSDFVIQVDKHRKVVKEWDLRQVLDVDRTVFREDFSLDFASDWFHLNSVAVSPRDNGLLVSGRNQGVVKLDQNNRLQWILAPHKAWGKVGYDGSGPETTDYLLTAVDESGNPLPPAVQEGIESSETFEWPTGQHALNVLENGNLLLFDNGLSRNFQNTFTFSRAVEYEINDTDRTIRQVWEYGRERGLDFFSGVTSDVDVLPKTNNRLITAGNVRLGKLPPHASMVEVTYPNNEVVFEANLYLKDAMGTGAQEWAQFDVVYRGERYPLY